MLPAASGARPGLRELTTAAPGATHFPATTKGELDDNHNGKVSRSEFSTLDANKDGRVTHHEASDLNDDGRVTHKEKTMLDSNDDGKVNRHEILHAPSADLDADGKVCALSLTLSPCGPHARKSSPPHPYASAPPRPNPHTPHLP